MTRLEALLALLLLAGAAPTAPRTERAAILAALRPAVEARLGKPVEFLVTLFRSEGGWAFVVAEPRRKGGAAIDGKHIFGEDFANMDGLRVDAVLRRSGGRWVVVDHAIGATDVWYCDVGPRRLKRGWGC